MTQHIGDDHRAAGPGLNYVLGSIFVLPSYLYKEVLVNEGTLLQATWHVSRLLSLVLASTAATNNQLVALFVGTAGTAFALTVRVDRVTSTGGLAFTTTMRVIDRVHDNTADGRAYALPAHTASLTPVDVGLLSVANFADGRAAARINVADFAGGQTQLGELAFLGDELNRGTGRTSHLGTATGTQLHSVDNSTHGDVAQREVVARLDVSSRTGFYEVSLAELVRGDDVTLGAIDVVQEGNASGAVGIVFDLSNASVNAILVVTTEVNQAVLALVATTLVTSRDTTSVIAATLFGQGTDQRLLRRRPRDFCEVGNARAATARGCRLVFTDSHSIFPR
ncbi:hypothetical protein ART_2119 [Arthrobacter sp. PAMC 25486]|nr:hypothetical protein ART_2119 [Arthrobacter sp. PAMC 25486]